MPHIQQTFQLSVLKMSEIGHNSPPKAGYWLPMAGSHLGGGGGGGLLGFCGSALHTMPRGFKRILMHFVLCFVFFLFWSPSVFVAFLT